MNTYELTLNNQEYAEFYYIYNKISIKINTIKDLPNVIVFFNLNNKKIIVKLHSLFILIYYFRKIESYRYDLNKINEILFIDIESKYKIKINTNDIPFFYKNKIYLTILYKYKFSKDSLHGYLDINIENIINKKIYNLNKLNNYDTIFLQIDNINLYKTSVKILYKILEYKRDGLIIPKSILENESLRYSINNNSIYDLFISIK